VDIADPKQRRDISILRGRAGKHALEQSEASSSALNEIIGAAPSWITRWGVTVIVGIVALLLIGSAMFSYPDIIQTTVIVLTPNPPASVVARTSSNLFAVLVSDSQAVESGDVLAVIQSSVDYTDFGKMQSQLAELGRWLADTSRDLSADQDPQLKLGELSPYYANLRRLCKNYHEFEQRAYDQHRIHSIRQQLTKYRELNAQLGKQVRLLDEDVSIALRQYERDSLLRARGLASVVESENARIFVLQKRYALESARASFSSSSLEILKQTQLIAELEVQFSDQKKRLLAEIRESFDDLTGQASVWEHNYLLRAPIDGIVSFTMFWSPAQYVRTGTVVFTVVPQEDRRMIGKLMLPAQGAGKVKVGQHVNVKFANFPYLEFGIVDGLVAKISFTASDDNYIVEIGFPQGLKTSYGQTLQFSQEMQGVAEIITDDVSLLARIFRPIKSIVETYRKK
jgi:multidrug resistance efflux pump